MIKYKLIFIITSWLLIIAPNVSAGIIFECDFEKGYQFLGVDNSHPGGGYISQLGGDIYGHEGSGCSDPKAYHNTVISGESTARGAVLGSLYSLKTPYRGSCPNESFSRDTTIIRLKNGYDELYVRWYQKFTGEWNSADVQHKFTKFYNSESPQGSLGCHFSFGPKSNYWRNYMPNVDGRFDKDGVKRGPWVWVYESKELAGSVYEGVVRSYDDINNALDSGNDGSVFFQTNRWYCIEMHFKINTSALDADGLVEAWVDGVKTFEVRNLKFWPNSSRNTSFDINVLEFQHIYYNRSSTDQATYMDNIIISDEYIGPLRVSSDTTSPSAPTGIMTEIYK